MPTNDNDPGRPSLAHQRQAEAAAIVRDCFAGPLQIRKEGRKYLPQFPREEWQDYEDRLNTSVFYDWFGRTVRGLTGMVFRDPPTLADDLPDPVRSMWENVDLLGTHGDVFFHERHEDGETDGHFVVFVDMSSALRRPYMVGIKKQDVLAALLALVDGVPTLVHFRYRLEVVRASGRYGQGVYEQVREYNLIGEAARYVEYIVHERPKGEDGEAWMSSAPQRMDIDEIPVVSAYHGDRLGPFESSPPHLALALENIKHYQLVSDNDNVLHLCSVPQLAVIGADMEGSATLAPHGAWNLPQGGDLKYAEPEGNGLAAAERRIATSEHRMAVMGLSSLQSETRSAETATSKRINKSEQDSALALHARATNDAIEECIRLAAKWLDIELPARVGRWVTLRTDFGALPLDSGMVRAYVELFRAGFPARMILEELQSRGALARTADLDDVEARMLGAGFADMEAGTA